MKKKITIVGAGFTGVITALILSKKYNVTIIDSKEQIGGILTDINYGKEKFLKSCQYLDIDSIPYKLILKKFRNQLKIFSAPYSSYTVHNNKMITSKDFANPVFNKIRLKKKKYSKDKKFKR